METPSRLGAELVRALEQLGGGPQADPAHAVPRFVIPAACWIVLALVAHREWRRGAVPHNRIVSLAALLGASRELGQLLAEYGSDRGLFAFSTVARFYPPLEHGAGLATTVLVAFAFLRYRHGEVRWLRLLLWGGLGLAVILTAATLPGWWRLVEVTPSGGPRIEFAQYVGEVPFRLAGVGVAALAIWGVTGPGAEGGRRGLLVTGFALLGLDDALMLVNLAVGLAQAGWIAPVRHNLHMWAVPTFLAVYWNELRAALGAREAALRLAADHQHRIFESVPDPILVLDGAGLVREFNAAAYALLARGEAGIQGAELAAAFSQPAQARTALREAAAGIPARDVALTVPGGSGPVRDVLLTAAGSEGDAVVVLRDITEQKQAEASRRQLERAVAESQRLESLGVLAAGVAHDFNNLLSVVLGNAAAVLEDLPEGSSTREAVEHVLRAAQRAGELSRQLMACAGGGLSEVVPLELGALTREMAGLLRTSVGSGRSLQVEVPAQGPALRADPTQVRQVITNLVLNAAEAMPEGSGTVRVRVRAEGFDSGALADGVIPEGGPGRYAVLEVADDGAGMTPEVKARIFQPFFTTKFTGRGLGLASVMGIVRGHGGGIQVETAPGLGTTFRILWPLDEGRPEDALAPVEAPRTHGGVLVVDDEELILGTARRILVAAGYRVILAVGGQAGLEALEARSGEVAVVLLDLTMPVVDGTQVLSELCRRWPALPVVISSGWADDEVRRRVGAADVAGYLRKPWTPEDLRGAVERALLAARRRAG